MKARSPIVLELVRQGYVRGSKEFKAAYQRELRKRRTPKQVERDREKWRRYYRKKVKEDPEWNSNRIQKWREENPLEWEDIMKRASTNGLHRRFYERHKEKIIKQKSEYGKRKRREDPTFGFNQAIRDFRAAGKADEFINFCRRALARADEGRHKN
jgi:succinate dehydrogenase/fumarate reductase flavoprotein subunit